MVLGEMEVFLQLLKCHLSSRLRVWLLVGLKKRIEIYQVHRDFAKDFVELLVLHH